MDLFLIYILVVLAPGLDNLSLLAALITGPLFLLLTALRIIASQTEDTDSLSWIAPGVKKLGTIFVVCTCLTVALPSKTELTTVAAVAFGTSAQGQEIVNKVVDKLTEMEEK